MINKNTVELTSNEIEELKDLIRRGTHTAGVSKRAHVLLLSAKGKTDNFIAESLHMSTRGVEEIRKRFSKYGFEATAYGLPIPGRPSKLTDKIKARIVAEACQMAPDGESRQTLRVIAEKIKINGKCISHETVRKVLKESDIKPWQSTEFCIPPEQNEAFVENMENVLRTYERPADPDRPVICMDESPFQLLDEVRSPIKVKSGSPTRVDNEYIRRGTANLFVFVAPKLGIRRVDVTDRRTRQDFAEQIRKLVYEDYPHAKKITLVLDNLNAHNEKSLQEFFPPAMVKDIMRRLKFTHTPVHGSWLNSAECEIGCLKRSGLKKRIPTKRSLKRRTRAYVKRKNKNKEKIVCRFTVKVAREKLKILQHHNYFLD
jgi:hypothetical protein